MRINKRSILEHYLHYLRHGASIVLWIHFRSLRFRDPPGKLTAWGDTSQNTFPHYFQCPGNSIQIKKSPRNVPSPNTVTFLHLSLLCTDKSNFFFSALASAASTFRFFSLFLFFSRNNLEYNSMCLFASFLPFFGWILMHSDAFLMPFRCILTQFCCLLTYVSSF